MKRTSYLITSVLIIVLFNCCSIFSGHDNTGLWFYQFTSQGYASGFDLTPQSFLCLSPDKTYTLDFGNFEYGKWSGNTDTILLQNSKGDTKVFVVTDKNANELKLSTEPGTICNFDMLPYSFKPTNAKPFSLDDNKWRIKATHKESDAEIRARLINHCRFWKDYFNWALDNKIPTIDVRGTPTPIKIYGNGFELKFYYDLPDAWKNYFYDSADCQHANDILSDVMTNHTISLAHTDDKYKMFIGAFEQMEAIIRKKKD